MGAADDGEHDGNGSRAVHADMSGEKIIHTDHAILKSVFSLCL